MLDALNFQKFLNLWYSKESYKVLHVPFLKENFSDVIFK